MSTESTHTPRPDRERPPVYTVWEAFLGWPLERTADIPKAQRFSFGQRIDAHTLDVLELIVEAIFVREKRALLDAVNRKLEVLQVLCRLVQKRGWISLRQLHFVQDGNSQGLWRHYRRGGFGSGFEPRMDVLRGVGQRAGG